ncbi:MAG: LysM peptidoglycan-binding domain-containing protein [Sandaracinaceae bacterium]
MTARLAAVVVVLVCLAHAGVACAQLEHTVRSGQSLARIARRYDVSVANLAAANNLGRAAALRPGQVLRIPETGVHYVGRGEALATIAREHGCSVAELRQINHLRSDSLRLGQRLELPGFDSVQQRARAERQWGRPRSPGVVSFYRRSMDRRLRVRLVDQRGRARRVAVRRLQELMRSADSRRLGPSPPQRLLEIVARLSDHFGGREITIVSGYRAAGGDTRTESRHVRGHALDIRVRGVPNTELRDYVRTTFNHVGVGFYPRSHFIHVDVRDRDAYWVDWSGPGESAEYQRRGESAPGDATDAEVQSTGFGRGEHADSDDGGNGDDGDVGDDDGDDASSG